MSTSKHKAFVVAWALLALVGVAGCSTLESGYSTLRSDYVSWEGHPASDLLASWGEPDTTEELGADYVAYTWLGDDGVCRRTFMSRAGTITGYSETDC